MSPEPAFSCDACGATVGISRLADVGFHCPNFGRGDSGDHVLRSPCYPGAGTPLRPPARGNPFLLYRERLTSWHLARALGLADADFVTLVEALDAHIARLDGHGFVETPFDSHSRLDVALGFEAPGGVLVKDETRNVAGSHKARHLLGVMLYLQVLEHVATSAAARARELPMLAIASCGNAALAAAVVARAAGRRLDVFVPPSAARSVLERLESLGARIVVCDRREDERGDPCYLRFHEAIASGAVAFCCQGPDNALTVEGGETIAWEMIDRLSAPLDRLFLQVGGGAFASACVRAFLDAVRTGRLAYPPRVHAVQTAGGFPLARAWARVALRVLGSLPDDAVSRGDRFALRALADVRADDDASAAAALRVGPHALARCAAVMGSDEGRASARRAFQQAAVSRPDFMWPWEGVPQSAAHGILDDETYDWRCVVEAMILTCGWPVVVDEYDVERANRLGRDTTGIDADHTGTSGFAGLLGLLDATRAAAARDRATPLIRRDERIAVVFSGARR